jgi:hypothetical protein
MQPYAPSSRVVDRMTPPDEIDDFFAGMGRGGLPPLPQTNESESNPYLHPDTFSPTHISASTSSPSCAAHSQQQETNHQSIPISTARKKTFKQLDTIVTIEYHPVIVEDFLLMEGAIKKSHTLDSPSRDSNNSPDTQYPLTTRKIIPSQQSGSSNPWKSLGSLVSSLPSFGVTNASRLPFNTGA